MKKVLILPRIKIQNANALSSSYTIGFPAITAWLGATHALQRKLKEKNSVLNKLTFNSVAIVSHDFNLHTYKGTGDYNHSIISTRNPLKSNGKSPSTIEAARCHLTVSLVIEYAGIDQDEALIMKDYIPALLHQMKIASGDVLDFKLPELKKISDETETKQLMAKLMPGYCLIERRDLVRKSMRDGKDGMDSVLKYLTINSHSEKKDDEKEKIEWTKPSKQAKGWLVPIAVGYQGISDLTIVQHQRDNETQHRFAESMITLGEFIMPTRIDSLDHILWRYAEVENDLYRCQQNQPYQPLTT